MLKPRALIFLSYALMSCLGSVLDDANTERYALEFSLIILKWVSLRLFPDLYLIFVLIYFCAYAFDAATS